MDALEQINEKIKAAEEQFKKLESEMHGKKKLLADKKTQQAEAVLSGFDTSKIIAEISEIQLEIEGIYNALKMLGKTLEGFRMEQVIHKRSMGKDQAEEAKAEALKITAVIYSHLVEIASEMSKLKRTWNEYQRGVRAANQSIPYLLTRLSNLINYLEANIPKILEAFPAEIFKDGSLPKPDDLKKRLRRSESKGLPFDPHGSMN